MCSLCKHTKQESTHFRYSLTCKSQITHLYLPPLFCCGSIKMSIAAFISLHSGNNRCMRSQEKSIHRMQTKEIKSSNVQQHRILHTGCLKKSGICFMIIISIKLNTNLVGMSLICKLGSIARSGVQKLFCTVSGS